MKRNETYSEIAKNEKSTEKKPEVCGAGVEVRSLTMVLRGGRLRVYIVFVSLQVKRHTFGVSFGG